MNYQEALNNIETGDLIAVKGTEGFLTPFTRFFTRSDYTHVGIAYWMNGKLWMVEINGGKNHLIPMTQLADEKFDVFKCPIEDKARVEVAIELSLKDKIPYGYLALFVVGLINYLRIKVFIHARRILECAGFCVMIYETAGWPEHTRILSPKDLTEFLQLKVSVY
jgi:hypothetical protein